VSGILQLKHHKAMWCNGRKFRIKKLDEKRKTSDCGITAVFEVTNVSSRSDRRPEVSENRYYGYLEDILECDFKSFKIVLFDVKWYRLRMNERDPDRTVILHDNGFTMVNTRSFEPGTDHYVLPRQCEQVFYSEVPGKAGWSFVVRYDPRGRPVKYNIVEEENDLEEEDDAEEQVADVADVSDEEPEGDEPNVLVGGNADLDDDIHDEDILLGNEYIDDDVDTVNPYNTLYEPDDMDVQFDEDDQLED
jgi:hypothetical protein